MTEETYPLGTWLSTFSYQSAAGHEVSEKHLCLAYKKGNTVVLESSHGVSSYLLVRLIIDDRIATGSWEQQRSKEKLFGGARLWGTVQMVISADGRTLNGMWTGFGSDTRVISGSWEINCIEGQLVGPIMTLGLKSRQSVDSRSHHFYTDK